MLIEIDDEDRKEIIGLIKSGLQHSLNSITYDASGKGEEIEAEERARYGYLLALFEVHKSPRQRLGSASRKERHT
jgi:hypothetical protein